MPSSVRARSHSHRVVKKCPCWELNIGIPWLLDIRIGVHGAVSGVCQAVVVITSAPQPGRPRDPGDAWVQTPSGVKYWGKFGAAGLLAVDAERGVLLQHRVSWSHFGGTWGLPGGARHQGESAVSAALREAAEEAGVPPAAIRPRLLSVNRVHDGDQLLWSYTTLVGDVTAAFEPVISDSESTELAWVPVGEVDALPLHPGLAAAWPRLRELLPVRPVVIVDVANVMGSVPDGWWRDRAGAASRLLARISALAERGVSAEALSLPEDRWYPRWIAVVEGEAKAVAQGPAGVSLTRAEASGDDAIVAEAVAQLAAGQRVTAVTTVVTSDRALSARVREAGATVRGARWLLDLLT